MTTPPLDTPLLDAGLDTGRMEAIRETVIELERVTKVYRTGSISVAALRGVDYVVIFGDSTVERLLTRVKPDVHCKGTDYTIDSVPERAIVAAYGGRTAIVGDPKRHASRDLVQRISRL